MGHLVVRAVMCVMGREGQGGGLHPQRGNLRWREWSCPIWFPDIFSPVSFFFL